MRYWRALEYPASAKELNETNDEGGSDAESLDILRRFPGLRLRVARRERKSIKRSVTVLYEIVGTVGTRELEVENELVAGLEKESGEAAYAYYGLVAET